MGSRQVDRWPIHILNSKPLQGSCYCFLRSFAEGQENHTWRLPQVTLWDPFLPAERVDRRQIHILNSKLLQGSCYCFLRSFAEGQENHIWGLPQVTLWDPFLPAERMSSLQNTNTLLKLFIARLYEIDGVHSETEVLGLQEIAEDIIRTSVNFNAIRYFDNILSISAELFLAMYQGFQRVREKMYGPTISQHQIFSSIQISMGGLYSNGLYVGSCFVLHNRYVVASPGLKNLISFGQLSVKFNFWQQNEIPIMINSDTANISSGNYFKIIPASPDFCILKLSGMNTAIPPGLYNQSAKVPCNGVVYIVNPTEIVTCLIIPPHLRGYIFENIVQRANSNPQCYTMETEEIGADMKCIHQFTTERFTSATDTDIIIYLLPHPMNNILLVANEKGQVFAIHILQCPYTNLGAEQSFIGKAVILEALVKYLKAIGIDVLGTDSEPMTY
ncbi:uncharacterized protein LOC119968587 [Scyliorhinus canicula]|uniref:uncharacterized protein LOC119968587 n=1 Tax=Scyliorhinus canicula TaxID=7830 RepID=UPI0018F2F235|nr:uncharacterized protein LOC119968587 [Scyliorhinus canicula]